MAAAVKRRLSGESASRLAGDGRAKRRTMAACLLQLRAAIVRRDGDGL